MVSLWDVPTRWTVTGLSYGSSLKCCTAKPTVRTRERNSLWIRHKDCCRSASSGRGLEAFFQRAAMLAPDKTVFRRGVRSPCLESQSSQFFTSPADLVHFSVGMGRSPVTVVQYYDWATKFVGPQRLLKSDSKTLVNYDRNLGEKNFTSLSHSLSFRHFLCVISLDFHLRLLETSWLYGVELPR